jgi:hypothetical protein
VQFVPLFIGIIVPTFYFVTAVSYRHYKKVETKYNREFRVGENSINRLFQCCESIKKRIIGLFPSNGLRFESNKVLDWSKPYKQVRLLFRNKVNYNNELDL